ncbi:fimbrial protein [Burkholderia contaminans]|uniref:fimbrial protein n=1 Tax=Burkholderia contaminans TaxID=488447 RepID=UPI0024169B3A|nr:fimbrial protein [Burkholderia contaminans]WFN14904.1 fimbrial protein [Burkholderia contaminans]
MKHVIPTEFLSRIVNSRWLGRRTIAQYMCALLSALCAMFCAPAFASFSCTHGGGALSFNVPNGHYTVSRDTPIGTRITPFIGIQQDQNVWTCSETTSSFLGPIYQSALADSGQTYTEAGLTYEVFNTNLAGVGVIMAINSYVGTAWYPIKYAIGTTGWNFGGTYSKSGGFSNVVFGVSMNFAFVKTGPITPGVVTWSGPIANVAMSERPLSTVSNQLSVSAIGNPTFNVASCTTPNNIPVALGTHMSSEFTGVNSVSSSVGFNIALTNCPAGMSEVDYEIDAVTTVVNATNSVVALDSSSTASGIGVQLLDGNGSPVPLGSQIVFNGYSSASGGNYTIPFRARYYQTGTPVTPGLANTLMTFTMSYY